MIQPLKEGLLEIAAMAKMVNCQVTPFLSEAQLLETPESLRNEILNQIRSSLDILADAGGSPEPNIESEKMVFRAAMKKNKYQPMDDVESYFSSGEIVEIYDLQGIQKYRNLAFLNFCSYDLFTLYSRPFIELYERGKEFDQQIFTCFERVVKSPKGTEQFLCGTHLLKEKHLKNRKVFEINPRWISPLIGESGQVEAVVLTNRCHEYQLKPVD